MKTVIAAILFLGVVAFAGTTQAQTGTFVWVDADGEVVGPFIDTLYLDGGGFGWHLDPENGIVGLRLPLSILPDAGLYRPGYLSIFGDPIRVVFRVGGLPGRWVRSDTEQGQK